MPPNSWAATASGSTQLAKVLQRKLPLPQAGSSTRRRDRRCSSSFRRFSLLADSIAAVGLMIAFYYGITGFACVWYYRRELTNSWQDAMRKGIMPALGGLMLLGAFVIGGW